MHSYPFWYECGRVRDFWGSFWLQGVFLALMYDSLAMFFLGIARVFTWNGVGLAGYSGCFRGLAGFSQVDA